jgi:hypothetical protein
MPRWKNQPLVVYHGTDTGSLPPGSWPIGSTVPFPVNLARCRPLTDFGQGFYTTTNQHQAEQWANTRVLRLPPGVGIKAVVLAFAVDRDDLARLDALAFLLATFDFWDLVTDCRYGFPPHARAVPGHPSYDVVYGPVTLWPQNLVLAGCDQISFHTPSAVAILPSQPVLQSRAAIDLF